MSLVVRSLPTPRTQTHPVSVPVLLPMPLALPSRPPPVSPPTSHRPPRSLTSRVDPPWQPTSIASPPLPRLPPHTPRAPRSCPHLRPRPRRPPHRTSSIAAVFAHDHASNHTRDHFQLAHLLLSSHDPRLPQLGQAFFLVQTPYQARIQFDVGPTERH